MTTKATLYLEPSIYRALKTKAAQTDQSLSALANDAIKAALAEDLEDIKTLKGRAGGSTESYESFLTGLKADGIL